MFSRKHEIIPCLHMALSTFFSTFVCFTGLRIISAMLYQVNYRASLHWKSHTYEERYVMEMFKCITLQIMQYGKSV